MSKSLPVACTLSDSQLRERGAKLWTALKSNVTAIEELPDGYAFRFPGTEHCLSMIANIMIAERECCRFLTFELAAEPNLGPLVLRVRGPAGTKQLLSVISLALRT